MTTAKIVAPKSAPLSEPLRAMLRTLKERAPYGQMCRDPNLCLDKGYCPRDPTCGD